LVGGGDWSSMTEKDEQEMHHAESANSVLRGSMLA
jgi:hypothetical protein